MVLRPVDPPLSTREDLGLVSGPSSQRPPMMSDPQLCCLGCKLSAGVVYPLKSCRKHSVVSSLINNNSKKTTEGSRRTVSKEGRH